MGFNPLKKFKNIADTLGRQVPYGKTVGQVAVGGLIGAALPAVGIYAGTALGTSALYDFGQGVLGGDGSFQPSQPGDEDLKYTSPIEEQIHTYLLTAGLDELYESAAAKRRAGQPLTAEELDAITQGAGFLG
ncbi:hypothetical protein LCGC14_3166540, partial [marine sediment metagenome]